MCTLPPLFFQSSFLLTILGISSFNYFLYKHVTLAPKGDKRESYELDEPSNGQEFHFNDLSLEAASIIRKIRST